MLKILENKLGCCLIGEDSLVINCGNFLLARNYIIRLVISPCLQVEEWAGENSIPWSPSFDQIFTNSIEIDYLFSIVNSQLLSSSILQWPSLYAINYHDSLLPKYAGINATTWAILNDEKEHGITWHLMNERIDEGDILVQETFPVEAGDTALTLNLRCYEHAVSSFPVLLNRIEENNFIPQKQSLNNRSYYGATHPLPDLGFIDWENWSAEYIFRITRALSLGRYDNKIGSLKLLLETDYYIVAHVQVQVNRKALHDVAPGTILEVNTESFTVSTITDPCKISSVLSKSGKPVSINSLFLEQKLCVGQRLPLPSPLFQMHSNKIHKSAIKDERYWVNKINAISEHSAFSLEFIDKERSFVPMEPRISLKMIFPNKKIANRKLILLTAIFVYLYRLNGHEETTASIYSNVGSSQEEQLLYSCFLPLFFNMKDETTLDQALIIVQASLNELEQNPALFTDLSARYPLINGKKIETGFIINLNKKTKDDTEIICPQNTFLYFHIDEAKDEMAVWHRLFCEDTPGHPLIIANCIEHLVSIIVKLVEYPHLNANRFCFLTQAERYQQLQIFGKGKICQLPEESLSALFDIQAKKNPDKIAIHTENESVSYQDLALRANQVARFLISQNLSPGSFIGIYLNRNSEMIAVIIGILKAGCAYIPLDSKYPMLKIEQIIEDVELKHLIVDGGFSTECSSFFNSRDKTIQLYDVNNIFLQTITASAPSGITSSNDDLAYIIFTSGTTGRPKGVMVTQKNIINYCKWFSETTQFNETSIIDFSSSIAFDLSVPCTLAPLLVGASLAIASDAQKKNPKQYLLHLKTQQVTHVELTPGYLEMLLNYSNEIKDLGKLKYLLLGADAVPANDVQRWLSLCPEHQIVNEYGPTETTVSVTSYFVEGGSTLKGSSVPIGQPAYNSTCYVLDKYKNLCPSGIKGELYIGGSQVARGYFNQKQLTENKFIRLNLGVSNEVVYKTGDIACWQPDGNLQFHGRNDHQVKIQGYRVELPAVESVLSKIPGIIQAVVVVRTGKFKESYLRAYLVINTTELSSKHIRYFLGTYLPTYMIPKEFCVVKSIPLKENEKIDFSTLEQKHYQFLADAPSSQTFKLSSNEEIIGFFWKNIFHTDEFTENDDFFDMGGDSLMAMQLMSELKNYYQISFPLQLLFEHTTILSLAKQVDSLVENHNHELSAFQCLVKLSQGTKTSIPLFLIHPVGGSVFWYKQLASHFEGKYTIYGIHDIALEGSTLRFKTMEEMAGYYLNQIKKVYRGDDFCLGGASFGATVAFEMAHQLVKENKSVRFLGLFDGWALYPEDLMQKNTSHWLNHSERGSILDVTLQKELNELEVYRKELLLNYKLMPLNANAVLFKASELWPSFIPINDPKNGWNPYISGELVCHTVAGSHETMFFEPHLTSLAKLIDFILSTGTLRGCTESPSLALH